MYHNVTNVQLLKYKGIPVLSLLILSKFNNTHPFNKHKKTTGPYI